MRTSAIAIGYNLGPSRRKLIEDLFSYCNIILEKIVDLASCEATSCSTEDTLVITFGEIAKQLVISKSISLPALVRLTTAERNKELRQQAITDLTKLKTLEQEVKQKDLVKPSLGEKKGIDLQKVKPEELIAMLSKDTTGNVILDCHPTIEIRRGREEKRKDGKVVLTIEEAVIISLSANLLGANRVRVEEKKGG